MKPLDSVGRRRYAIALAAIVLLGLSLRLYQIGAKSLWFDEAWSIRASEQSIAGVFAALRQDVNPPVYILLLHFWMQVVSGDAGIRFLSALCSTLNIPVMYLLGRRIVGRPLGLLAALILAIAPFHIMYAQEARMYALLALFVSLSLYFLVRLFTDPRAANVPAGRGLVEWWHSVRPNAGGLKPAPETNDPALSVRGERAGHGRSPETRSSARVSLSTDLSWLGFIFSTAAAMLTHNTAVFLLLGVNYHVWGKYLTHSIAARKAPAPDSDQAPQPAAKMLSRCFFHNWLTAQIAVLLLFIPWLPSLLAQSAGIRRGFWAQPPTVKTVYDAWWKLGSACAPQTRPYNVAIPVLLLGLVLLGLAYFRRQPFWPALLITIGLAPFAGEIAVSLWQPIFSERTLIWASIPYYLLLAAGLLQLRRRPLVLAGLSALMVVMGLSLANYYSGYQKEQWREATAYVCERASEQDLAVVCAAYDAEIAFDYYRQRYPQPFDQESIEVTVESLRALPEMTAGRSRIWFVCLDWPDCSRVLSQVLKGDLRLTSDQPFVGLRVLEFVRE